MKKSEMKSKDIIIVNKEDDSDSEYSRDFELDRERPKLEKTLKNTKDKSPKGKNSNYNFEADDGDDDAFFNNL